MEIGRYRIVRPLGRGGTAEVFEAVAHGVGGFTRRVAIKRLLPGLADEPAMVRMFLDEAQIGSQLHHASIVAVLDFGISDGAPFQVLQFVDGVDALSLFELAGEHGRELPIEIVLYISTEIAHALHYAHTAKDQHGRGLGIVHRDVSPANILISYGADVLLTDFGIAFAKDRSERTAVGMTKGTLSYSAPEQATGGVVDARADIFALAATCHRLLCGRSPLAGEHAMADLLAGAAVPIDPRIPEDVVAILRRALERDRTARYRDASALADALGAALASRIATDPRSMLRGFLETVRPTVRPPVAKLDALLGLDLELVVVGERDGVRTFEQRTTVAPETTREVRAVVLGGSETAVDREVASIASAKPRDSRRYALLWIAGVMAVVLLGAGWAAVRLDADRPELSAPMLSQFPQPIVLRSTEPTPLPPAEAGPPTDRPQEIVPEVVAPLDPGAPTMPAPVRGQTRPTRPIAVGRPKPSPVPQAESGSGFVVIGGSKAVRAEVRVDGKSVGYAPRRFELSVGDRKVVLVDKQGQTIATRTVTITPRNTATSPLRWILE